MLAAHGDALGALESYQQRFLELTQKARPLVIRKM